MIPKSARCTVVVWFFIAFASACAAQNTDNDSPPNDDGSENVEVADKVEVIPVNSDLRIEQRLTDIMDATGWFNGFSVNCDDGVVFLEGTTDSDSHRQWAEQTAIRTSDVVAVVNQISLTERPLFDLEPARQSLRTMFRDFVTSLPLVVVALAVITLFYFFAKMAAGITRRVMKPESDSKLLRHVVATVVGVIVFLIGLHIALRVSGLTRLATTLLGGTGLIGLAIGFAFRDIAENFLSSVLLSLQHPFVVGDLIEVDGTTGYVRRVTTRATILATFEGNLVQIPNSTIYKNKITNFTSTPLSRKSFSIGIGYEDSAQEAQKLVMDVLQGHPAVVSEPEPTVLVDSLGSSTVNLKCMYWFDQKSHSGPRVNSALLRQAKQALVNANISMPDDGREIIFPDGVPVQVMTETQVAKISRQEPVPKPAKEPTTSEGEGDLHSDEVDVETVLGEVDVSDDENILETPTRPDR